jgi:3-oxoacyl-[acyl-carrier-protein] synthase-3
MINFLDIDIYLPKKIENNSFLDKNFKQKFNTFYLKTGIKKRRVSSSLETAESMAAIVAKKIIKKNKIKCLTHIISVTNSQTVQFPSIAHFVRSSLKGLYKNHIHCFGLNAGCSGYVDAIIFAAKIINQNTKSKILIITSDTYTKFIHKNDKSIMPLFGDGATATILSYKKNGWKIEEEFSDTIPNTEKHLISQKINVQYLISMNGPELINFCLNFVIPKIFYFIEKNHKKKLTIFCHQASKIVLNLIKKKILINNKNILLPEYFKNIGNLVSSTLPILLKKNIKIFNKSKNILLCGFGVGLTHSYLKLKK